MNIRGNICLCILFCILFFSILADFIYAADTTEPTPIHIYGTVSLCRDSKTWQPLEKGMALQGNDWIGTGQKSCLIFSINGKDTVTVSNSSVCALYQPVELDNTRIWKDLYLQNGSIWIKIGQSPPGGPVISYTLTTPNVSITTKGAVFEVVKGTGNVQPEEYWVWDGSITVRKNEKEVTLNTKERIIIMSNQDLPSKASRFNPANVSQWQKWNENKDSLITDGNYESLQKSTPPEVNRASTSRIGPSSGNSSGSSSGRPSGQSQPQGGNDPAQAELQRMKERVRVPPGYNPSF